MIRSIRALFVIAVAVVVGCSSSASPEDTIHVQAEWFTASSVDELTKSSDMVVVGTVAEVVPGQFVPAPETEDFKGSQYLEVIVEIDQILKGVMPADKQVGYRWFGYDIKADGSKGPQEIVEGIAPPSEGDRQLLFLIQSPDGWVLGTIDGRVELNGDQLHIPESIGSGAADELRANSLSSILSTVRDSADG